MTEFHVQIKIWTIDKGHTVLETSYDTDAENTHRLLFAIDPIEAAQFSIDQRLGRVLTSKRQRKKAHR